MKKSKWTGIYCVNIYYKKWVVNLEFIKPHVSILVLQALLIAQLSQRAPVRLYITKGFMDHSNCPQWAN